MKIKCFLSSTWEVNHVVKERFSISIMVPIHWRSKPLISFFLGTAPVQWTVLSCICGAKTKRLLREYRSVLCLHLEHCLPLDKSQLHLCAPISAPWKRHLFVPRVGRTAVTWFWLFHSYCISSWKSRRKPLLFRCVTTVLPAVGILKFLLRFLIK